jgi:hypothetical protein
MPKRHCIASEQNYDNRYNTKHATLVCIFNLISCQGFYRDRAINLDEILFTFDYYHDVLDFPPSAIKMRNPWNPFNQVWEHF